MGPKKMLALIKEAVKGDQRIDGVIVAGCEINFREASARQAVTSYSLILSISWRLKKTENCSELTFPHPSDAAFTSTHPKRG
jgi:hypothetical protein